MVLPISLFWCNYFCLQMLWRHFMTSFRIYGFFSILANFGAKLWPKYLWLEKNCYKLELSYGFPFRNWNQSCIIFFCSVVIAFFKKNRFFEKNQDFKAFDDVIRKMAAILIFFEGCIMFLLLQWTYVQSFVEKAQVVRTLGRGGKFTPPHALPLPRVPHAQ